MTAPRPDGNVFDAESDLIGDPAVQSPRLIEEPAPSQASLRSGSCVVPSDSKRCALAALVSQGTGGMQAGTSDPSPPRLFAASDRPRDPTDHGLTGESSPYIGLHSQAPRRGCPESHDAWREPCDIKRHFHLRWVVDSALETPVCALS